MLGLEIFLTHVVKVGTYLLITLGVGWLVNVERRLRNMDDRLSKAPSHKDIGTSIELRQREIKVMQREVKEDLLRMEKTLDKIIDKLIK